MRNFRYLVTDLSFNVVEYAHIWAWILRIEQNRTLGLRSSGTILCSSKILAFCHQVLARNNTATTAPPIPASTVWCHCPAPHPWGPGRPVSKLPSADLAAAAQAHCGAGGADACALLGGGASAYAASAPSLPFLFPVFWSACGPVWQLLPVGPRCKVNRSHLFVMSYGPLDMYRNPGPSGPQLRDFSSIIQTCSGNIQRISQASEPGNRAGGRGSSRGQAWVKLPARGARPGLRPRPHLRLSRALHSGGWELPSRRLSGPGSPRVPSRNGNLESFLRSYALTVLGDTSRPDISRVGGCVRVTPRTLTELTGRSVQHSISCHLPPPLPPPQPPFPLWPLCTGSCLLI